MFTGQQQQIFVECTGIINYGPPGPPDDHLPEKVLINVWSILEPSGNMLKGSKMF
jgi:hypothetical protein